MTDDMKYIPVSVADRPEPDAPQTSVESGGQRRNPIKQVGQAIGNFVSDAAHDVGQAVQGAVNRGRDLYERGRDGVANAIASTLESTETQDVPRRESDEGLQIGGLRIVPFVPGKVTLPPANIVQRPAPVTPHDVLAGQGGENHSGTNGDPINNYTELIDFMQQRMESVKPLSKEELERLRRKQRTEGLVSGLADLARSLVNLSFTTQYAPDMYDGNNSLSGKAKERAERAKAQRDADDDRYLNYALQIGRVRDAAANMRSKDRQQQVALQLKINEDARRQAKAEHDAEVADIDLQIRLGRLSYEEGRARKMDAEARLAEAYAEHADERVMSEINRNNRTKTGGRSGGGGNFQIRRRRPDGTYETRGGFKSAAEARNYVGTHSDEGWEFATTSVRTERTDAYGDTTVTVRNESSTATPGTDGNNSNEHFNIGW